MTAKHRYSGTEKVQNDTNKRRKGKEEREEGKKDWATFCFYIGNFGDRKTIHATLSKKLDWVDLEWLNVIQGLEMKCLINYPVKSWIS